MGFTHVRKVEVILVLGFFFQIWFFEHKSSPFVRFFFNHLLSNTHSGKIFCSIQVFYRNKGVIVFYIGEIGFFIGTKKKILVVQLFLADLTRNFIFLWNRDFFRKKNFFFVSSILTHWLCRRRRRFVTCMFESTLSEIIFFLFKIIYNLG